MRDVIWTSDCTDEDLRSYAEFTAEDIQDGYLSLDDYIDNVEDYDVDNMSTDEIANLILDDEERFWDRKYMTISNDKFEDFEDFIVPSILSQCNDDILIFSGSVGLWDGRRTACKVGPATKDFFYKEINEYDPIEFEDDNGTLQIDLCHHDGTHHFDLYTLPNDLTQIIKTLGLDKDVMYDYEQYDETISEQEAIEEAIDEFDPYDLENYLHSYENNKDSARLYSELISELVPIKTNKVFNV